VYAGRVRRGVIIGDSPDLYMLPAGAIVVVDGEELEQAYDGPGNIEPVTGELTAASMIRISS
jgi:hypothetical protein